MFCADYALSFVFHGCCTFGLAHMSTLLEVWGYEGASRRLSSAASSVVGIPTTLNGTEPRAGWLFQPVLPCATAGAASGFVAACVACPFDFVRRSLLPGLSPWAYLRASMSTVPYSAALFGIYFSGRDPKGGIRSQGPWALLAALGSVGAEAPFDKAKRAMFGGRGLTHLGANLMYAPFVAGMLVMYDTAALKHLLCQPAPLQETNRNSGVLKPQEGPSASIGS